MAKTWEQIIAEVGKVSEAQRRQDCNELLESMGMSWFEFMQTKEFHEMADKIAQARFAPLAEKVKQELEARKAAEEAKAEAEGEEKES